MGRDWDRDTEKHFFIADAAETLIPVPIPTEKPGAQIVGPVQKAVFGAAEPGLGAETQVLQVVIIIGLHKALESLWSPVEEGT